MYGLTSSTWVLSNPNLKKREKQTTNYIVHAPNFINVFVLYWVGGLGGKLSQSCKGEKLKRSLS